MKLTLNHNLSCPRVLTLRVDFWEQKTNWVISRGAGCVARVSTHLCRYDKKQRTHTYTMWLFQKKISDRQRKIDRRLRSSWRASPMRQDQNKEIVTASRHCWRLEWYPRWQSPFVQLNWIVRSTMLLFSACTRDKTRMMAPIFTG